ncbi:hypothetical protein D9C73_010523 [Collichthys lucidus]|uniref:Ig-like domain-containing protein n=1 Tax=Collichthys lucidus TaxID=240159 RepID=A0A4U5ULP9_COLLU|nr:hypothetical protein D9C73_010523 [Collichthys lucidus]
MADFRWIQVSLFVIALLQFTETEGSSSFTVRAGQEVTLPCEDVIDVTEHETNDQVELNCSVSTYGERWCRYTVKWLFEGKDVDEDHKDLQTSQSRCSASVTFTTSSNSDSLTCEVTHGDRVQLFPFRLQPSGEEPGDDTATKPRPEPTTKPPTDDSADLKGLWRFIIVSVGLAALIIIVVAVSMWTRTKGRKTQTDENMVADDEDDGAVNY